MNSQDNLNLDYLGKLKNDSSFFSRTVKKYVSIKKFDDYYVLALFTQFMFCLIKSFNYYNY